MTGPTAATSIAPPAPLASDVTTPWMLEDDIAFLNHGCFGARLRSTSEAQQRWREQFEARPVNFLERRRDGWLNDAKSIVGDFLGMRSDDFGFVTNATEGVNAVLRSLRFEPGDEIMTTNHVYNAVRLSMRYQAEQAGATLKVIDVPLPVRSPERALNAITTALSDRTRLLIVDHVTSPTAVLFPVRRIVEACTARGIDVLVDGAHAPGMLDLDVAALGAAYYTGNLHKWTCAPPGAAFLWVAPDRQSVIHPTVISHFLGEGLAAEFAWQGTRDISGWLAAGHAIRDLGNLAGPGSWPRIRDHNHALATWVQTRLGHALEAELPTPADGSMLGSMALVTLPDTARERWGTIVDLHDHLYDAHGLEVAVFDWSDRWLIRASCQVYNTPEQYERLASALVASI